MPQGWGVQIVPGQISQLETRLSMSDLEPALRATVRWDLEELQNIRERYAVFQSRLQEAGMLCGNVDADGNCGPLSTVHTLPAATRGHSSICARDSTGSG